MEKPTELEVAIRSIKRIFNPMDLKILQTVLDEQLRRIPGPLGPKNVPKTWIPPNMRLVRNRKPPKPNDQRPVGQRSTLDPAHKKDPSFLLYQAELSKIQLYMLKHRLTRKADCPEDVYKSFTDALSAWLLVKPSYKLKELSVTDHPGLIPPDTCVTGDTVSAEPFQ